MASDVTKRHREFRQRMKRQGKKGKLFWLTVPEIELIKEFIKKIRSNTS